MGTALTDALTASTASADILAAAAFVIGLTVTIYGIRKVKGLLAR